MVKEFLSQYGMELISTVVVAIMGFIGICIKNIIKKLSDDKTKEQVCKTVVKAVEQMYADLTGDERYEKAVESISEILEEKGIAATELEVKMLIESAVKEMNINLGKTGVSKDADNYKEKDLSKRAWIF